MMGNQLDTTHADVLTRAHISIVNDSVYDLTGISYFTSLQSLDCRFNRLNYLPKLPNSLKIIFCGYNYIDSLDSFPDSLVYFNCVQNSIDTLPELPNTLQKLVCINNRLTALPALDSALTHLFCSGNLLTTLPSLPDSLNVLSCYENQLSSLPSLPTMLDSLICSHNNLSTIPTLPLALTYFDCGANSLASLPSLSANLNYLDCWSNNLVVLPTLPNSLEVLICGENQLTSLPLLPAGLQKLKCYFNQLTFLPSLPNSLLYLDCHHNNISALPALPNSLTFLNCSVNYLTSLPTLSLGLNFLYCNNNLLNIIPSLPATLLILNCNSNPLTGLPALNFGLVELSCSNATLNSLPSLPPSLINLVCSYNNLFVLPALPSSLNNLNCSFNSITSLPSIPSSLNVLHCEYNQINCFDVFPFTLNYLTIHNNPFSCLPNYTPAMDMYILNYPLCIAGDTLTNLNNCPGADGLVGFVYSDANSNCVKDSSDLKLRNIPMKLFDNSGSIISQTTTAINGVYDFPQPPGTYTIQVDTTGLPIMPVCPSPGVDTTLTLTPATNLITDIDFDFNCKPGFDVGIQSIGHCSLPFPGTRHLLHVNAGDITQWFNLHCASGISGIVKIKVTGPVVFDGVGSGALSPLISGDTYTYNIADFGTINNSTAFSFHLLVDSTAGSGSPICIKASVLPVGIDNNYANNTMEYCYQVVNSHDPNYKETYPKYILPGSQEWVSYTVHFQNTGNAPAHNIRIQDTLDSNLDLTTFQVMDYSHFNTTTLNGNVLTVRFPNIMLPDSTVSADSSQAYIQYRIKPKANRPVGTFMYNTAYIYFDYNEPVITNTTINIFEGTPEGVNEEKKAADLIIYPNPSAGFVTIEYKASVKKYSLRIVDVSGRIVKTIDNIIDKKMLLNIEDLDKGIYFISIIDEENIVSKKIIKQ